VLDFERKMELPLGGFDRIYVFSASKYQSFNDDPKCNIGKFIKLGHHEV
jgi:hypothetical protein